MGGMEHFNDLFSNSQFLRALKYILNQLLQSYFWFPGAYFIGAYV